MFWLTLTIQDSFNLNISNFQKYFYWFFWNFMRFFSSILTIFWKSYHLDFLQKTFWRKLYRIADFSLGFFGLFLCCSSSSSSSSGWGLMVKAPAIAGPWGSALLFSWGHRTEGPGNRWTWWLWVSFFVLSSLCSPLQEKQTNKQNKQTQFIHIINIIHILNIVTQNECSKMKWFLSKSPDFRKFDFCNRRKIRNWSFWGLSLIFFAKFSTRRRRNLKKCGNLPQRQKLKIL